VLVGPDQVAVSHQNKPRKEYLTVSQNHEVLEVE
jgi:hypothetical protein